ncbi:MAG: AAA family ATPase [Treponemataceae bacterium]|nr:MAG: AAA family ATPase [Treponemataceae bacterium]
MFLQSLDIFGFKSFADKTHIDFADGITALLGPNGCGKSNVVDAIKWVLGEQGARNMRAEKMEDVIFAGTEERKALNVAEVTLTISNETKILALDVPEIAIKRRLYRSGEGEYLINGSPVKLKDIRELFWDTGVGKTAYSVMEQGKIDQILSSKPEERRYLFEEAAGITRFKVKRQEAERKLALVEENIQKEDLLRAEVKKSYDALKIQSEKTLLSRKYADEIFNFELDLQLLRLKSFTETKNRLTDDKESAIAGRALVIEQIAEINRLLSDNMDTVNEMEKQYNDLQKDIYGLAIKKQEKENLAKDYAARKNEVREKVHQLEGRKITLADRIDSMRSDIDDKTAELYDKRKRIAETEKNIQAFTQNIEVSGTKITENDKLADSENNLISDLDNQRRSLQDDLAGITEDIVGELDSKLKDAGYSGASQAESRNRLVEAVAKLKSHTTNALNITRDFLQLEDSGNAHDAKDAVALVKKNADSFAQVEKAAGELESAIEEYAQKIPSFLDEFLSPEGIITKKRSIDSLIGENLSQIDLKRQHIDSLKAENTALVSQINEYRRTLEDLKIQNAQAHEQIQGAENEINMLKRQLTDLENALTELENELFAENSRLASIIEQIEESESEISELDYQGKKMTSQIEALEAEMESKNSDLSGAKETLLKKNDEAAKFQREIERCSLDLARNETEIRNLIESFRENHSRNLIEFEERMFTITENPSTLREKLAEAKSQKSALGQVNFMAVEDFEATKERYELLNTQIGDMEKARENLKRVADEMRAESTELFLSTYTKIKKNFHNMFRRLFSGGRAELQLLDSRNVLESGVDILAQPPGKKLENIALLSGGEKTMTAVALLFATYMVRPSPFCFLDEIDAALDDHNVTNFVHALRDFSNVSQYVVITHNKKTATCAQTLLGITMQESGISTLVALRTEDDIAHNEQLSPTESAPFEEEDVPSETVYIPPHTLRVQRN